MDQEERLQERRRQFKSPSAGFGSPKERFQEACRERIRAQKAALVSKCRTRRLTDSLCTVREVVLDAMEEERRVGWEDDDCYDPEFWEEGAWRAVFAAREL